MGARHCPALLIAAPASGQGKTTVTAALARLHTRQGRRVRVFKCGPDFLDPMIHARASGAPVYQLDLAMVGEAESRRLLWQAAGEADLILIEGVMGLFDGKPSGGRSCTPLWRAGAGGDRRCGDGPDLRRPGPRACHLPA